ncbi:odorant-binding protein-like [Lynx rufus]|uniref:odorant-binding protein-like n=1 Tax=Lynx rufus TaxID=61384 RepID=UPI001F1246A4|nr:odorant-binding protein-like [Lynx rufus]XP_046931821.1 odorant-binding protein-like [Lynx rufus]XP_046931822.1 odorant-binding protein-like [Lynx rufus]XP_046931823.1 odorant-binding protein-like [Lynx rufus]
MKILLLLLGVVLVCGGRLPLPDGRLPLPDSLLPLPDGRLPLPDSRLPLPDGRLPLPDGRQPLPDARLPLPDGRLPLPDGHLPLPDGRLPLPEGRLPLPDSHPPLQDNLTQLSGEWNTLLVAATNVDKISNGPFHGYMRKVDVDITNGTVVFNFSVMMNGLCTEKSAVGTIGRDKFINIGYTSQNIFSLFSIVSNIGNNVNTKRNTTKAFVLLDTNGNTFHIGYDSLGSLIIRTANVDRAGHTTQMFALLGKRLHPDDNDFAKFRELMRGNNIPEENLIDMSKTGKCPRNERGTNPS